MYLSELLNGIEYQGSIYDLEVQNISSDSRKISSDCVFVCMSSHENDGHDYAMTAVGKGAIAVVCERDLNLKSQIIVKNSRFAYAKMCQNFYGNPSDKIKLIGVTGTNGKTTVAGLIKHILTCMGIKCGLIGTIAYEIGDKIIPADKTTPDPLQLQSLLDDMVSAECEYCVMEVSSHALHQYRLGDCRFHTGIFTNLTPEHLDYHNDMENYYQSKKMLFDMTERAVVNIDDGYGKRLASEICCETTTISADSCDADFCADEIKLSSAAVEFLIAKGEVKSKVKFAMPGKHSVYNALTAAAVCIGTGICIEKVTGGLGRCKGIPGRSEVIYSSKVFTVIRDYAHTPDGLLNILSAIKEADSGRLVVLFGCGGDRDKSKRPAMGEITARYADFVIVTSDNPRTEDPDEIIADIVEGVKRGTAPYEIIPDRRQAITKAVKTAQKGDVILLAGKGHEDYQILGDSKIPFDEKEIVKEILLSSLQPSPSC
ncbi:MAG: UDP-N-acetylmuramoyl-L-alanyl-D-glutamate--2,6-diaminopimelate ligase [Oscillospiraceae bacterium]|nr:UDP-N-acetylmuramoyl-L-alanyl-D-glutamate--2,6-diaminopimelate ligase [Oscillospiraceae bacterium]